MSLPFCICVCVRVHACASVFMRAFAVKVRTVTHTQEVHPCLGAVVGFEGRHSRGVGVLAVYLDKNTPATHGC